MILIKTFKGYEDRTAALDEEVNSWVVANNVDVVSVKSALSHEPDGRAKMGDLIYTVLYRADAPIE